MSAEIRASPGPRFRMDLPFTENRVLGSARCPGNPGDTCGFAEARASSASAGAEWFRFLWRGDVRQGR